ncbi:MAG: PorT family protein [Chloroflexia bacterium]|nr:PorT family protein [Chloroflexia bacterium]
MKQIKLYLLLVLMGGNFVFAQDSFVETSNYLEFKSMAPQYARNGRGFSMDNFSVGIKGGINFSLAIPLSRSSVFSGQSPEDYEKDYNFFLQNRGMQMGFILMYDVNRLIKVSLQPSSNDYTYKYSNTYAWTGTTVLQYEAEYAQKLRFFEVPLIVGFYMANFQTWQPYFQGGIYYGRVLDATTSISIVETSTNLVGQNQSLSYTTLANSKDLYGKNHFGVLAGAGISYLAGSTRIGLEANYRLLLTNLNTTETQFSNNQVVSGGYDVPDKFKFSNLAITLNVIVPLVCKNSSSRGGAVFCQ